MIKLRLGHRSDQTAGGFSSYMRCGGLAAWLAPGSYLLHYAMLDYIARLGVTMKGLGGLC